MKKLLLIITLLISLNAGLLEDIEKFNITLEKAKNGDSLAEYFTAIAYFKGFGTQKDKKEGYRWLVKALYHGELKAMWFVSKLYKDTKKGLQFLDRIIYYEKKYPQLYKKNSKKVKKYKALAHMLKGKIYQFGNKEVKQDNTKAIANYLKAFNFKEVYVVDKDTQLSAISYLDSRIGKNKELFNYALERENFTLIEESIETFEGINDLYTINKYFPQEARYRVDMTPLLIAIQNDDIQMAKKLIKYGANINLANSRGETPLLSAMRNKHIKFAQELIQIGADTSILDCAKNSVFSYAIAFHREDIALEVLENKKFNINTWVDSEIFQGTFKVYAEYIHENKYDDGTFSYLHLAARHDAKKVMEKLIKMGLNINDIMRSDRLSLDTIGIAARYGSLESIKLLIKNGANPYVVYINAHPEGNYGISYWGGLSSKYTLLSMSVCREKVDKNIEMYLLSLKNAKWYIENESEFFYFYLLQIKNIKVLEFFNLNKFKNLNNIRKKFDTISKIKDIK